MQIPKKDVLINRGYWTRYNAWKADFRKRFPTDEDVLDNIRKKYRWPRFNKYSRAGKEEEREKIQAALRLKEEEE